VFLKLLTCSLQNTVAEFVGLGGNLAIEVPDNSGNEDKCPLGEKDPGLTSLGRELLFLLPLANYGHRKGGRVKAGKHFSKAHHGG
jgi:hypothetical protein